ncbi:MAG TPA: nucleotidyltransferase domain-containing protein [Blastocatellia bacterium]|nr:nucleotidyltransferase domain-containing protein [Blastocatellia bacterium]
MSADRIQLPESHSGFLDRALAHLTKDSRVAGVAAGGSYLTNSIDEYSDLDLVVFIEPSTYESVMSQRQRIAGELGPLLAAFTGEHVGEPRLLICLYGPPLLHVDLKFVSLEDAGDRIENPAVLFERDGCLTTAFAITPARFPDLDLQWIEDRFWVWIHYAAAKIGRGELMEACDFLAFLRAQVLGPLALKEQGARPTGVRKIESAAAQLAAEIQNTITAYDSVSCLSALEFSVDLYRRLRIQSATKSFVSRKEAETAACEYLQEIRSRVQLAIA